MEATLGWHQDPTDATVSRYWDGAQWSAELIWNGTEWATPAQPAAVAVAEPVAPAPVVPEPAEPVTPFVAEPVQFVIPAPVVPEPVTAAEPAQPAAAPPVDATIEPPAAPAASGFAMTTTSWILGGGALLAAIGATQTWEKVSSSMGTMVDQTPTSASGGAMFILLALVALVVWLGWPTRTGSLSKPRLIGLGVVAGLMSFFVLAKFHSVSADQAQLSAPAADASSDPYGLGFDTSSMTAAAQITVEAGIGLYLWTCGVIAIWVGAAKALIERD